MRVHLWLLVVLVPAVAGGFFDRMVARYRERREHRHEERFRPIFVDYQDEMEKLIAENAANMESEHPEFALGVPVSTGYEQRPQTRQRYRRERLRGLGRRPERTPTEEGQRGHEEVPEQERPRNRLRGAGMLLFGRRRRPPGRPRLRTPPTPVPPTTTRPTETPPHHIRLPTAIDGFDGISPSTRRPAAYIGPHGRVVLRDRVPVGAGQPPYQRRPPHRAPSERRRPVPARRHPVRGCRGRTPCVEGEHGGLMPMPLPTPPANYRSERIRPADNAVPTEPWTTKIQEPAKTRQTSEKPSPQSRAIENHLPETMDPSVNPGRGSRRTTRTPAEVTQRPTTAAQIPVPESKESLPGGEALFEAMTSVLDTARVAMLAMMPHVPGIESASYGTKMTKASSSEDAKASSSALSDDPMLGQGSTEHSGSFAKHTVKPMPDLRRLRATTSHPTVSNFDTNDMLYTRQEETEEEKEQDSSDIRWAKLLAAAGEEDLATVYGMLERARENREIMSRVRSRQRFGFQGTSKSGENHRLHGKDKSGEEATSFRDQILLKVKEREEITATNTASIRAQLKAIVESLENEPNRPAQAVGQSHDGWKAFDKYSSGRSSVSEIGKFSQHPSMPPEVHKLNTDEGEPVFRSGEERLPISGAPVIYAIWGSRRDKDKHIGRTSSETDGKPIHTFNAGGTPTHYVDDGYPLNKEALFSSQDQARHYHDEKTNLNDKSEQQQGTQLSHPNGSAQLDKGAGLGFREPSHNRNSKLSRVPAEEDGFSNGPQSAGGGRDNRYILGPSDLRDVEYTHQDGDSFVEDGINARLSDANYSGFKKPAGNARFPDGYQVRPSIVASENDFTPRPIQLHKPYFEIHPKTSKIQADIQQSDEDKTMDNFSPRMAPNIASTEDAGLTDAKEPSDEAISEITGSNSSFNSGAGQDQVDEQTSPSHSTVPGGRRTEDTSSKVRPAEAHSTSTDVLHSGQPANEPQQNTGTSKQKAGTTTSLESEGPSTASPQAVAEVSIVTPTPHPTTTSSAPSTSDQAALQETDQPTFATTVQSAPSKTSQPTASEETVKVSLTLEELMRLISQVSQKPPSAMEETLSALGIENITEKTREEHGHEIVHAPKINGEDNSYEGESEDPFEHVESGENVENVATRPMESTSVKSTDKTFPAHYKDRTFHVHQREDDDEMEDTSFMQTYPRTTSSSIDSEHGQYTGSLRPPPTAPMSARQYQSTEASRSDDKDDGLGFGASGLQRSSTPTSRSEVLLTTEVIPEVQMRSTLTTEHLPATIPSTLQTSQPITSPTYVPITSTEPTTSPTTTTTSDASYLREPPTSADFPTTQASPPVVEMFAIPTFSEWLVAPPTEASTDFIEGEEATTSSMMFEAVAVPTVDDWFETVTSSPGTTTGLTSAANSQPTTTTRPATATTYSTSITSNPSTTTTSTSTSTTLQAFTTGTMRTTTSPATRATSSKPTMISSKSSPRPTTSQKPPKISPEPKTTSSKSTTTSTAPVTSSLEMTTTSLSPTTSNLKPETTIPDPTKTMSLTTVASSTPARSQTSSTSDQSTTFTATAAATTTSPTTTTTKSTTTTTTEPTTTTTTKPTTTTSLTTTTTAAAATATVTTEPTTTTTVTTTEPTTTTRPTATTTSPTTTTTTQTTTTTKPTKTTRKPTTTTEPTTTTTSQTTTTTRPTTTMLRSVPTTTTEVPPIKLEEVTTRPLSLLEQVMTRSVPFIKKRRRLTTPISVESTTDGSKIEPIQTTSSYKEPSSVMPRPNEHTTANPGLVIPRRESLRDDVDVAKSDIQATDEEDGDYRNTPTKSPLPKMSPELRMALVRELLKQMQATRQSNQKKTKVMLETKPATQNYPAQLTTQEDDGQPKMQMVEGTAADASSSDEEEDEEDPPPIEDEPGDLTNEPSAQIDASQTDSEGSKQKMEANKASNSLKVNVKVDTEVKTEAERIAALLKGDVPQTKTTSIHPRPEKSEESQEPVTPSAFLRALRERVKNRPSIRGSRKKTRPKPRRRGKIRKSLPRGPRPSTEDEEDETEDGDDESDEEILEEDSKHSEQPRAKLHQLVNAELNSQNDEKSAEETDNQG